MLKCRIFSGILKTPTIRKRISNQKITNVKPLFKTCHNDVLLKNEQSIKTAFLKISIALTTSTNNQNLNTSVQLALNKLCAANQIRAFPHLKYKLTLD